MKDFIRKLLPRRLVPFARRIYWLLFHPRPDFSSVHYKSLRALKCTVAYNKYGGYCVPLASQHRSAAAKILLHDVYEPQTIGFIMSHCGNADIVHAGTFFGDFLPPLSQAMAPDRKIWAYEPNPENYRCTKITLEINAIDNVVLTHAALGAKVTRARLQISENDGRALGGGSKIVTPDSDDTRDTEEVDIVTIDDTVPAEREVSIIHLDIEGYEKEALSGALATIKRCLPILILETWPGDTFTDSNWFAQNILILGYRKTHELHGNQVFSVD